MSANQIGLPRLHDSEKRFRWAALGNFLDNLSACEKRRMGELLLSHAAILSLHLQYFLGKQGIFLPGGEHAIRSMILQRREQDVLQSE